MMNENYKRFDRSQLGFQASMTSVILKRVFWPSCDSTQIDRAYGPASPLGPELFSYMECSDLIAFRYAQRPELSESSNSWGQSHSFRGVFWPFFVEA